jgi:uncharacterized repeat protein (TIGR02543 family)
MTILLNKSYSLLIFFFMLISHIEVTANIPHAVFGVSQYSNGNLPATLQFTAYIKTRSWDQITENSPGCFYNAATGQWVVQCSSFNNQWSAGDILHIDFDDGDIASGSCEITLTNNAYDEYGTVTLFRPTRIITITTDPVGLNIIVEGITYTAPQSFQWEQQTTHQINVETMQSSGAGTRHYFISWSQGGDQNQTYTVPGNNETLTALFGNTQYYLTIQSDHGNPQGAGWYDQNTTASFSVTTPDVQGTSRYLFIQWSGNYSGTSPSGSVTMNAPKTVTAHWNTQYTLAVNSTYGNPQGSGWYNKDETAYFSVTSPDIQGDTRHLFSNWTGDHSGTSTFGSVIMDRAKSVTAQWNTEHYLTTSVSPAQGGSISPQNGWIANSTIVTLTATAAAGYQFVNWSGHITGNNNPYIFQMVSPMNVTANFGKEYHITLDTQPTGLSVSADGITYTAPHTFSWVENSLHTISVSSPINGSAGTRYVFSSWSDGGAQNHTYIVPAYDQTITASFVNQYLLTVQSDHGNPQGTGWYDENASASFSVTSPDIQGTTQYLFSQWTGDYSGSSPSGTMTMNGPKTVTANWNIQYMLSINSSHGTPQGSGWYDENTTANFSVTTPDIQGTTRYIFNSWSGDYSGISPSGSVLMDQAKSITAYWTTEYYLTTSENPGQGGDISPPPPGDWYVSNTTASLSASAASGYQFTGWTGDLTGNTNPTTIQMTSAKNVTANFGKYVQITIMTNPSGMSFSADGQIYTGPHTFTWAENTSHFIGVNSPINSGTGTREIFTSWSDGGAQNHTYIVPGSNQTVTVNFTTQYYLTLQSNHGNPQGGGWYNENADANFSVSSPDINGTTRYIFTQWTGDYTGTSPSGTVNMNMPKTITAEWETQYFLNLDNGGYGTVSGGGWYTKGSDASFYITPTGVPIGPGIQQSFNGWTGTGNGAYTGPNAIATVKMNNPIEETAVWKEQYYLSITLNPTWGGTTQPASPGAWLDPDSLTTLLAIPNTAQNYKFSQWSGDVTGSANPVTITMNTPKSVTAYFIVSGTICITTQPSGLTIIVDDTSHTSPEYFNWISGSSHYIIVPEYQENNNQQRKAFVSWSDGGARGHWITIGQTAIYTALFKSQYYLSTAVNPLNTGQLSPEPPGIWCDENENRKIEATAATGYLFSGWTGDLTGAINPAYILIDGPKTITAHFGFTNVDENTNGSLPSTYFLDQNHPNPFNPETMISYHLPERSKILLDIYNLKGQKVRTLYDGWKSAGSYTSVWDGKDNKGKDVNSGIFLFILRTRDFQQIRKGTLIR